MNDIDAMEIGQLEEYVERLAKLPPIGSTFLVSKKKG